MGAFLLGAGIKGKRYSMPNARIMIHQPLGGASGQVRPHAVQTKQGLAETLRLTRSPDMACWVRVPWANVRIMIRPPLVGAGGQDLLDAAPLAMRMIPGQPYSQCHAIFGGRALQFLWDSRESAAPDSASSGTPVPRTSKSMGKQHAPL
jgi:hypothetical protein